jgi:peptidoglycan/xylan/chitin deacetylase (PgdA/CDA1 family)
MMVNDKVSALYHQPLPEIVYEELAETLAGKKVEVFFRADDIGLIDVEYTQLLELFLKYEVPLCLAVVPRWLDEESWREMARFSPENPLWCWHQHGYSHENHESAGKKNEFGAARTREEVASDIQAGKAYLETVLGELFCPVFTPPWNRCSGITLELLKACKFRAVSRSINVQPETDLPDLCVNVDLHTGKEKSWQQAVDRLLMDWRQGVESGRLGIMIHHQRMNSQAFVFLERLLQIVRRQDGVRLCTFRELF